MDDYTYDRNSNRYRDKKTGRFISERIVRSILGRNIKNAESETNRITNEYLSGNITVTEWKDGVGRQLKILHIQNYLLGKGGKNNTFANDYLEVGRVLKQEYSYLRQFSFRVEELSDAQIRSRVNLYLNKTKESYYRGRHNANGKQKFMRRILGITDNHCAECLSYAALGWQPYGALPMPTVACTCRANCLCRVEYDDGGRVNLSDSFDRLLKVTR